MTKLSNYHNMHEFVSRLRWSRL